MKLHVNDVKQKWGGNVYNDMPLNQVIIIEIGSISGIRWDT